MFPLRKIKSRSFYFKRNKIIQRHLKYLVGIDGSKESFKALKDCLAVVKKEDQVTLMHVIDPVKLSNELYPISVVYESMVLPDRDQVKEAENKLFKNLTISLNEKFPDITKKYECVLREGSPPYTLCEEVALRKIDYLFVGDRGLNTVKRVLLGSLSNFCLHYAPCTVVVSKDEDRADHEWKKISK